MTGLSQRLNKQPKNAGPEPKNGSFAAEPTKVAERPSAAMLPAAEDHELNHAYPVDP